MTALLAKIKQTIDKHRMLEKGDRILVALSGGPDSVALLYLLLELRSEYKFQLSAAHLDHAIRLESANDREFCKMLCNQLRARPDTGPKRRALPLRFHSKRIDVTALARRRKLSIEEAGRQARYEYLESLAEKHGYTKIATGHTLDDNVETVIFNIARGTGLAGLAGIPVRRGLIIRPLIGCEKGVLVDFLDRNKIEYVTDPTNAIMAYARNRIRNQVLPELEKLNFGARRNIARLSAIAAEELEYIRSSVVSAYNLACLKTDKTKIVLDLEILERYHVSLRKKVLEEAFSRLCETPAGLSSNTLMGALRIIGGKSGGKSPLVPGYYIEKSAGRVAIIKNEAALGGIRLKIPGKTALPIDGAYLKSSVKPRNTIGKFDVSNRTVFLDGSRLSDVKVRFWKPGDKIRPLGMRGHRLLSDIFVDRRIPEFERRTIPLVVSGRKIAWIAGVMISEDYKVTDKTEKILNIELCEP